MSQVMGHTARGTFVVVVVVVYVFVYLSVCLYAIETALGALEDLKKASFAGDHTSYRYS